MKNLASIAAIALCSASTSQAVVVTISSADFAVQDSRLVDFVNANFSNVTAINQGYYTTAASLPVGTEVLILGRRIFSGDFANAANSAAFNALTIPIVATTSFVTRPDGGRWGWESGAVGGGDISGSETTITLAGAATGLFGNEGTVDWWTTSATKIATGFNSTGTGTVGTGDILATLGGNILVAYWGAGDTTAGGQVLGGNRLLFNMPDYNNAGAVEMPNTAAGETAFRNAVAEYTPLIAIPEPSSSALLLGGLGLVALRRRRSA